MVQGTTPTLLFKFSVDLALIKEWRIIFYQDETNNLVKTQLDCITDENQVIYIKLTQNETLAFDTRKYLKIQAKALTNDNNVIPSDTITTHINEILDKTIFEIENTSPTIIDTSVIEFHFNEEHCQYGLDFEDLYIEQVGGSNITVDKELSITSTNPVQNKVITAKFNEVAQDIDAVNLKASTKIQAIQEANFTGMASNILMIPDEFISEAYHTGDLIFIANANQPDFVVVNTEGADNGYNAIQISSVEDISKINYWESGKSYKIGNRIVVATFDVGVLADYVNKGEFNLALQGKQDKTNIKSFKNGDTIMVENNSVYKTTDTINNLTIQYPTGNFICSFTFTVGDLTQGEIKFPTNYSKYIGQAPDFQLGETWEINIMNGAIASGKVVTE